MTAVFSNIVPVEDEYQNVSVTITASPASFTYTGGTSTLTVSCSYQKRTKYSDGSYSSWASGSTTPTIYNVSQPTGFSRSAGTVTVAKNTSNLSRSAQYGAKVTLNGTEYTATPCTITQAGNTYYDGFEWEDTEITIESGESQTVSFYCSEKYSNLSSYNGGVQGALTASYVSVAKTGNSSGWEYKGTATITANANSGGSTGTVTGTCAGKSDELGVNIVENVFININLTYDWNNYNYVFTADQALPCRVDFKWVVEGVAAQNQGYIAAGATTISHKMDPTNRKAAESFWLWKVNNQVVPPTTYEKDGKTYHFVLSIEGVNVEE